MTKRFLLGIVAACLFTAVACDGNQGGDPKDDLSRATDAMEKAKSYSIRMETSDGSQEFEAQFLATDNARVLIHTSENPGCSNGDALEELCEVLGETAPNGSTFETIYTAGAIYFRYCEFRHTDRCGRWYGYAIEHPPVHAGPLWLDLPGSTVAVLSQIENVRYSPGTSDPGTAHIDGYVNPERVRVAALEVAGVAPDPEREQFFDSNPVHVDVWISHDDDRVQHLWMTGLSGSSSVPTSLNAEYDYTTPLFVIPDVPLEPTQAP